MLDSRLHGTFLMMLKAASNGNMRHVPDHFSGHAPLFSGQFWPLKTFVVTNVERARM